MSDIFDNIKPRKGEKFHFVDFVFSIPARGMTEQEVREYAVEKFVDESYDIMKGLRRYPEHSTIGQKIETEELEDYFYWEEE
jgi:hypothetical protein